MKTMKHTGKKILSVFLAVLMVMTAWVFVAPTEAEAIPASTIKATNLQALNSIGSFNTDVTTIHGSFESDADYLSTENYDAVYHNVLFTDGPTTISASATSAKTEYGNSWSGSNGVTVYWYHPTATLLYDGDTSNLPRLGVAVNTVMYYTGTWSRKTVNRLSYIQSGGNGFTFNQNWHGSDGRLNFQWMWHGQGEYMGYTSTIVNDAMRQTLESDSNNHFYANLLKFTDSMGNNEFYRTATPTFAFYGDNGSSAKTITATTTDTIAIINYVPLKAALNEALGTGTYSISTLKNNAEKYTTASIAEYVAAVKALIAAKPNNYVNSNNNNYMGYADAASAAITKFNNAKAGLKIQEYTLTFDNNLFDFRQFTPATDSVKEISRTETGFTMTSLSGTDANTSFSYAIPVTPGKTYILSADAEFEQASGGYDMYINTLDVNQSGETTATPDTSNGAHREGNVYISLTGQTTNKKPYIRFTAGTNTRYIKIRFDANAVGNKLTINNIGLFEEGTAPSGVSGHVPVSHPYGETYGTLPTPTRTGYTFAGWVDGSGNAVNENTVIKDDTVLYSTWTEHKYNITFNSGIVTSNIYKKENISYTESVTLDNEFSDPFWTFTGWNTELNGSGTSYADGQAVSKLSSIDGDTVTLYAQWQKNPLITWRDGNGDIIKVTIDDERYEGVEFDAEPYVLGAMPSYKGSTIPIKDNNEDYHYIFNNSWSPAIVPVTEDATYYAQFNEVEHTYEGQPAEDFDDPDYHSVSCSVCGRDTLFAHTPGEPEEIEDTLYPPTCFGQGWITVVTKCTECGGELSTETKLLDPTNEHDWDDGEITTEAGCLTEGTKLYRCKTEGCPATKEEIIPATGHSFGETVAKVPADCFKTGMEAYKQCTVCNLYFAADAATNSAEGKNSTDAFIIPMLEHEWSAYSSNGNGQNDTHTRTCGLCNTTETEVHTWVEKEVLAKADCLNEGRAVFVCSKDCGATYEGISPAKGHSFAETVEKVPATCLATGMEAYKQCTVCNLYFAADAAKDATDGKDNTDAFIIPMLEHSYTGEVRSNGDGKDATHVFKCVNGCGNYGGEEKHTWNEGVEDPKATCFDPGRVTYTCTVDGCESTYSEVVPATGHVNVVATPERDVSKFCGANGYVAYWTCLDCDKIYTDEACTIEVSDYTDSNKNSIPDVLERKGPEHNFTGEYVIADYEKGTHHRKCLNYDNCKTYGPEEYHDYGEAVTIEPTCTEEGKIEQKCKLCPAALTTPIAKAPHKTEIVAAVEPGCITAGNNEYYKCSVCDNCFKDAEGKTATTAKAERVSALKHTFITGTDVNHPETDDLVSSATCQKPAVYFVKCDRCGVNAADATYEYGAPNQETGHKFDGEEIIENGVHKRKCTVEGCDEYGTTAKCDYEVTVNVASTCKTKGYTTYTCKDCGNGYSDWKDLDPDNHAGEGTYFIDNQVPTCATPGSTGVEKCSGCDTEISRGVDDIPVDPDNHENMIDYEGQAATCQTKGWKDYRYCDKCQTYEIEKVEIEKKSHLFITYVTNNDGTHTAICDTCDAAVGTPATDTKDCSGGKANCQDKKVCTICKSAYGEVDSNNHKTVVTIEAVPATCQTEGTKAYAYCKDCEIALDEIVKTPMLTHTYGEWTKVDGEDKHTRSCKTCKPNVVGGISTETADCSGGTANCVEAAKCTTCKAAYGDVNPEVHKTTGNTLKDVVAATCQAAGFSGNYRYDCCNAIKVAGTATPKLDHNYTIEVEGTKVAATCIAKGEVTYKCSTCVESEGVTAATQKKELPIDANNHANTETTTVGYKAATCESDGYTGDEYYECCYDPDKTEAENRNALKEKGTVIKANGEHKYGESVPEYMIEKIEETKDENGKVTSRAIVKKTGEITYDDKVNARDENGKWYHKKICTVCYEIETIACYTFEHTSNCTETDICEECGGLCSLKSPLVHKGTLAYEEKVPATCTEDGVKAHYVCDACGGTFSDAAGRKPASADDLKISSAGGNHDIDYSSATPIDGEAKHEYSCNRCSAKIKEDCEGGINYCNAGAKCDVCGQEYGEIDEANHASTETTLVGRVEATCSEDGYEGDEYYECCYDENKTKEENQKALKKEGKVIPSKPELHVIVYKDTDGDTHTAYCTACAGAENAYSETVAHKWVEGEIPELKNCTDTVEITSTCVCGKTKTETIVGEHDLETKVDKKAATCISEGYEKTIESCKKCDYSATTNEKVLPKLPHNVVTEGAVKPTCDNAGKNAYSYCKNPGCPYGYKKDLFIGSLAGYEAYKNNDGKTVDKLGHQDKDNNGSCDNCYKPLKENIHGTTCDCICHKQNVFMKFLYKILQFFWKLFKIEQTCGCGTKHW